MAAARAEATCEVWPENELTVRIFLACDTQWRWTSGMTTLIRGLDYTAVESVMRIMAIRRIDRPRIFDGIRIMEAEALRVYMNKRAH